MPDPFIKEVALRYTRRRLKIPDSLADAPVRSAPDVACLFSFLADEPRETLIVAHLDSRNHICRYQTVSVGTLTTSLAHPREIFQAAVITGAGSLVLVHNHPSGDPSASAEDDAITSRIAASGALLGVPLLDHVIVGEGGGYYSYQESRPDLLEASS